MHVAWVLGPDCRNFVNSTPVSRNGIGKYTGIGCSVKLLFAHYEQRMKTDRNAKTALLAAGRRRR